MVLKPVVYDMNAFTPGTRPLPQAMSAPLSRHQNGLYSPPLRMPVSSYESCAVPWLLVLITDRVLDHLRGAEPPACVSMHRRARRRGRRALPTRR